MSEYGPINHTPNSHTVCSLLPHWIWISLRQWGRSNAVPFPSPALKRTGNLHCLPPGILLFGKPKTSCKKSDYSAGETPWRSPQEEKVLWSTERSGNKDSGDLVEPTFPAILIKMSEIRRTVIAVPAQLSPNDCSSTQHYIAQKSHRAKTEIHILCKQKNNRNTKIFKLLKKRIIKKNKMIHNPPNQEMSSINILLYFF